VTIILVVMISILSDISLVIFIIVTAITFFYIVNYILRELNERIKKYEKTNIELSSYIIGIKNDFNRIENELTNIKDIISEIPSRSSYPREKIIIKKEKTGIERRPIKEELNKTEREILKLLSDRGPLTSSEIREQLKLSREHVARTLKKLYDKKMVERDETTKPYKYMIKKI